MNFQNQFSQKQTVMPQQSFLQQPITGLKQPNSMNWGASNFVSQAKLNSGSAISPAMNGLDTNKFGLDYQAPKLGTDGAPSKLGGWSDKNGMGGMALGVAQVGLGVYNAMEQSKMNKFMKSYYGDQMDLMKADYSNNARSANEALSWQRQQIDSASGIDPNSAEGQKMNADYMAQWGAKETV